MNAPPATMRTEVRPEPSASRETALTHIANIRKTLNIPMNAGELAAQGMQAKGWRPRSAYRTLSSRPATLTKRLRLLELRSHRRASTMRCATVCASAIDSH